MHVAWRGPVYSWTMLSKSHCKFAFVFHIIPDGDVAISTAVMFSAQTRRHRYEVHNALVRYPNTMANSTLLA